GKYFVLSFPHSNAAYIQLNYGENLECLLEALRSIFEYIGSVPNEIWFDNASAIVNKIIKGGGRIVNDRFMRFSEHYRFKAVFMNPESGWEKGNVENKVGYSRRNLLVPIPEFDSLTEFNKTLFKLCDEDMDREHYKGRGYISQLYPEDKAAFHPLPANVFDTARYETLIADKYGKVRLDGKYLYSASPAVKESEVTLRITSSDVTVYDHNMNVITCHKRLYGDEEHERMDWGPYLRYIARKPRSLRNSGIYDMMPANMQAYLDKCCNADRGAILKALAELTDRDGFDNALLAVDRAIDYAVIDPDSLKTLHNRLFSDVPLLPALDSSIDTMLGNIISFRSSDLSKMDLVLTKGGASNG
nr:IS21 family transposase [Lachnospiraceae bacterium]